AGKRRVVAVQQSDVGVGQQLAQHTVVRGGGLDGGRVPADHGPLPRRLEHGDGGDGRYVDQVRGDVAHLHPAPGELGGDRGGERAHAERGQQHRAPAEGGEGHSGVGGRSAGGDELLAGGDLLIRTGRRVDAVDDVEGREAGEHAAGAGGGHGPTVRGAGSPVGPRP